MQWIRSQRPGESGINIITADFVELGEFISAVITLNYHLDDDEDDATWETAGCGGWQGAQSPPPLLWSVLSLFSLWHLFQEGSCTASFTLFRAIVNGEILWQRDDGWKGETTQVFGWSMERLRFCLFPMRRWKWFLQARCSFSFSSCAVKLLSPLIQCTVFQSYHVAKGRFCRAQQPSAKCYRYIILGILVTVTVFSKAVLRCV